MKQSTNKPRIASKAQASQEVLSFVSQPEHALTLLGMLTQAQLSIKDLLGQISKCFIEQLLVLSAQQVGGTKSTPLAMSAMCAGTAPTALSSALARPKLKVKHSDAAASMLEGLEQMFTAATLGVQGTLACNLSNTNVIESPNSVVCRHSQRGDTLSQCRHGTALDGDGLLGKRARLLPIKDFAQLPYLIRALRLHKEQRLAASWSPSTSSNLQLSRDIPPVGALPAR